MGMVSQEWLYRSSSTGIALWEWFHGNGSMGMAPWEWFHGMEGCWCVRGMSHSPHIHGISVGWDFSPLSRVSSVLRSSQTLQYFPENAQNVKEVRSVCEAGTIHSWGKGRGRKSRIARGIHRRFQRELKDSAGAAEFGLIP